MSAEQILNNPHSGWMDEKSPEYDVVISSRVRAARNLRDLPFPHVLSQDKAEEVINAVEVAVKSDKVRARVGELELFRLNDLPSVDRHVLVEKHLISMDLLKDYQKKALALKGDESLGIMVNEEDHLRLQCLMPGLQLSVAWETVNKLDDGLGEVLNMAFNEQWGYLTTCPTNVGTGIRASVMVHLPGLVLAGQVREVLTTLAQLGLMVRGLYGEGTEAFGDLFQISNQITLGRSEEDIIANLVSITGQLIERERAARQVLFKERREQIEDRVCRAYGILKYARIVSAEESMRLFSDLRLGIVLGLIQEIPASLALELMIATRPAFLVKIKGGELSASERDVYRAKLFRNKFAGFKF